MNILAKDIGNNSRRGDGVILWVRRAGQALRGTIVQRTIAHRGNALIRRTVRRLDHLDDRLLKDVGLFRDQLPDGSTIVKRR